MTQTLREKIAEALVHPLEFYRSSDDIEYHAADAILSVIAESVEPLQFPERRGGYWGVGRGIKGAGYQVAHTQGEAYRVRLNGRVICKEIKGLQNAIDWANAHNRASVLSSLGISTPEQEAQGDE